MAVLKIEFHKYKEVCEFMRFMGEYMEDEESNISLELSTIPVSLVDNYYLILIKDADPYEISDIVPKTYNFDCLVYFG